jgi:transcriptional regulator with XRE-family HTH domain
MSVGTAIKHARGRHDMTQGDLAGEHYLSRSMVAEVERGAKRLPKDVAPKAARRLDDGFLAMEIAHEFTGGAWIGRLNGKGVDLHRSSVRAKTIEELDELSQSIDGFSMVNAPGLIDHEQRKILEDIMIEACDVVVAVNHLLAVSCEDYGISWYGIWDQWKKKALASGYIAK